MTPESEYDYRLPDPDYIDTSITPETADRLPSTVTREIINDVIYMLASPSWIHQWIVSALQGTIWQHIKGNNGSCKPVIAPLDVYMENKASERGHDILQPDLMVICNPEIIKEDGIHGAPDMIVEVTSPTTAGRDFTVKLQKYLTAGVREYWIVEPVTRAVTVFLASDPQHPTRYSFTDSIPVACLPGLSICLESIT